MNRRYPDTDDLWQAIAQEDDPGARRELLAQMARVLLELEDSGWEDSSPPDSDSTASLLEYQAIGKLAATHIQQALPWLDPDYKGEPLEQELQQTRQELQTITAQIDGIRLQQAELHNQQTQLDPQRQTLQSQQHSLQSQQQTLEQTRQDILSVQQAISSMEEEIARLQTMLEQHDEASHQIHIFRLLEEFNPILQRVLGHYRQLASVWQLHLEENDETAKGLTLLVGNTGRGEVQNLPRIAENIANRLREYDSILSELITRQ
jgi:predicted RNase H-like nuclease (RuvC/YqgF family)